MEKHTATPWSINNWPRKGSSIVISAIGTPLIALIEDRDTSINEQKANATFVVKAVNSHAALVTALKATKKSLENWMDIASDEDKRDYDDEAIRLADEALALAEEESQ